jgi:hypothetical protein
MKGKLLDIVEAQLLLYIYFHQIFRCFYAQKSLTPADLFHRDKKEETRKDEVWQRV